MLEASMHSSRRLLPLLAIILSACSATTQTTPATGTAAAGGAAEPAGRGPASVEFLGSRGALSQAVRVGNLLYLAGQLGTDSARGITPETRMAMEKIKANVERYGSSMDRVVKCTVFLVDMSEWAAMNAVYTTYFAADKRPARSAIGSSGLVGNGRVEIECIAVLP
jgi:reactive intermediate/imine deaminase